ncbi:hypothetical protein JCM10908_004860 [Rhodotorula pacifica]|uniref:uncharacterized protein n=1 Tax=Rhodotorula pacifica TaxID=1495444 RepID=UPI003172F5A7
MSLSLEDEPSFDLSRAQTSTPNRAAVSRFAGRRGASDEGGDEEQQQGGAGEPLHESDTDSVAGDAYELQQAQEQGNGRSTPLTRRSLLQLARNVDHSSIRPPLEPLPLDVQPGLSDRRTLETLRREHLYAPSPSTGSSTLVDRDFEPLPHATKTLRSTDRNDIRNSRTSPTGPYEAAEAARPRMEGIAERDGTPSEDESAASQQLRRSRIGDLASFVDSRLSERRRQEEPVPATPRRQAMRASGSSRLRNHEPNSAATSASTPRRSSSQQPEESLPTPNGNAYRTNSPNSLGSSQVHDVFKRLITGPDGALAHSAERRAAAAASTRLSASLDRYEPPTPAPPGHYTFVPSSSLPVQRDSPRRTPRERAQLTRDLESDEGNSHPGAQQRDEDRPSQLERALQHLGEAQRDSAGAEMPGGSFAEQRRSADTFAYETTQRTRAARDGREGRSAIDFAMAESSAFSHSEDEETAAGLPPPLNSLDPRASLRNSVRFAAEPTYRTQSPSRSLSPPSRPPTPPQASLANQSTFAGPGAFPRSTSPDLPPLPMPLPPESPEPTRIAPKTRSPPSRFRRSHPSPPEQTHFIADEDSKVATAPISPARPGRRPGWERPASSTPLRQEGVEPPRPRGTPEHRPDLSLSRSARATPPSPRTWRQDPEDPPDVEPLRFEREPREEAEGNDSMAAADESSTSIKIKELVSQLSAAVRTLADRKTPELADELEPAPVPPARKDQALQVQLERYRRVHSQDRHELDTELAGIEAKTAATLDGRSETMHRLVETYELEHELGCRMDELKRSIEGMGQLVGDQVAETVGQKLQQETQTRARWFALACGAQIALFLFILRLVNAQHANMYASVYYDPFHPDIFHLPPGVSSYDLRYDPHLSLDTLAAFAPPGVVRSSPSALRLPFLAVKAALHRWVLPLLPKLRLSPDAVERAAVVPV